MSDGDNNSSSDESALFGCADSAIFWATLGGAILSTVDISKQHFDLLRQVERGMASCNEIMESTLRCTHQRTRSTYGQKSVATLDGNLLSVFENFSAQSKAEIVNGIESIEDGDESVSLIEGIIDHICSRTG